MEKSKRKPSRKTNVYPASNLKHYQMLTTPRYQGMLQKARLNKHNDYLMKARKKV